MVNGTLPNFARDTQKLRRGPEASAGGCVWRDDGQAGAVDEGKTRSQRDFAVVAGEVAPPGQTPLRIISTFLEISLTLDTNFNIR
jgi:hypothetical protein